MPHKTGLVVETSADGWAEVITDKLDACAQCVSSRSCHSDCRSIRMVTRVRNNAGARAGDTVAVFISSSSVLKSAAILYLIPITFLMIGAGAGALLGQKFGLEESAATMLFALVGLCLGFASIKIFSGRISKESDLLPRITEIIQKAG